MSEAPKSFVIKHKIRKSIYKYRTGEPYLSTSFFQKMSDYRVTDISKQNDSRMKNARILYVKSHLLDQLLLENWRNIRAKVLIIGGSDNTFEKIPTKLPSGVKHIFAQNSVISNSDLLSAIPIGIEPPHLGWNGVPRLMVNKISQEERINRILVGPFGKTNPQRELFIEILKSHEGPWDIHEAKMYPDAFADLHRRYKMTLCLAGNGLDTYRVWETLYRGGVPLVERNDWSLNMVRNGFPLKIIDVDDPKELIHFCATVEKFDYSNERILYSNYWKDRILGYL